MEEIEKIAQKDTLQESKIYHTWIKLDKYTKSGDVLYQTKDSSIIVANYLSKADFLSGKYQITKIEYKNIRTIELRHRSYVILVALPGLILGSLAGGEIGYSKGTDKSLPFGDLRFWDFRFWRSATDKAAIGGVIGGLLGVTFGTCFGLAIRIKIPINRSIDNFNKNKERLKKYSYIH
jgi:hypothetical protein